MGVITEPIFDQSENQGLSSSSVIRMDEQRSRRLFRELGHLLDEVQSLASSSKCFPRQDISQGEMCPALTVNVFTTSMQKRLFLLTAMVNGEEQGIPDLREVKQ